MTDLLEICKCGHRRMSHKPAGVDPEKFPSRCDGLYRNVDHGVVKCTCKAFVEPTDVERKLMKLMGG